MDKLNNKEAVDNSSYPTESIFKEVVHGGIWVFVLRFINRGLGFIRTIILARLLAPTDFGLLGIAMLSILTLETFSQTGFQTALVQKKENIQPYLDTAWTVSAIRGIFLFLILFFSAPLIAEFFNSEQATLIIRVVALTTLLYGLRNIGILFFEKELKFNKLFLYDLSATLVDLTVAITLAFILRNVWALVWGGLAGNCVRLLMSYILHPYRPKIRFQKEKFKELFSFGKWVFGSSILVFLFSQGDDIFVARILGVTALGFYQMAYLFSNLPATEITKIISQVTFPAYSTFQDNIKRLGESYLRVLQLTAFITIPLAGMIFILAPEFTEIFLGEKWMPMVSAMQALAFWGLIRSIGATTGPIFYAVGKPGIGTKLQFIQLIFLIILIYPLTNRIGILGTSLSVVFASIIPNLAACYMTVKITRCGFYNFSKEVLLPLINTMIVVLFLFPLKAYMGGFSKLSIFVVSILFFVMIYFFIIFLFDKFFNYRLWHELRDLKQEIKI